MFQKMMIVCLLLLGVQNVSAQSFGGTNLAFRGMAGYMGFGVSEFSVLNPTSRFRMDQGTFLYLGGEKEIGKTGLFITISINYMQSGGQTLYNYTSLDGTEHTSGVNGANDINFDSSHIDLGLGFKFKFFPTSWFRPYGEGGGLFGYHTIKYTNDGSIGPGTEPKLEDGLTGFGYYGEAGVEIDFSELWGIRAGVRYSITETRPFITLGDEKVKYEVRTFHFGIGRRF